MNLGRIASKLFHTRVEYWDKVNDQWLPTDSIGRLEVYDRFISDRSFGQRKRIFLTAPEKEIPAHAWVIRVGGMRNPWMVENINHDIDGDYPHLSVHMLQEIPYKAEIFRLGGERRPSGALADPVEVLVDTTYCNMDRYGILNAKDVPSVDYTVMSIYVPGDTLVDSDCSVRVDGVVYDVFEVSPTMNALMLRAQRRGA